MTSRFTLSINALILGAFLLMISSCEEPDLIGMQVTPPGDKLPVGFCDTFTVKAYSLKTGPIQTDETQYNLLGSYTDSVFGTTTAGFFTQIRLSKNKTNFGKNPIIDSLVLSLAYSGSYGDMTYPQTIMVYESDEKFYKDSSYYSGRLPALANMPILSQQVTFKPSDSVTIDGVKKAPHLRLRLDPSVFAQKILSGSGTSDFNDNTAFLNYIKGLFVVASPNYGKGGIAYFNLLSSFSNLTLYYRNDSLDSLSYIFPINEYCARFNYFNHYRYSNAAQELKKQIIDNDSTKGEENLYLQAMGGIRVRVVFPYLKNIVSSGKVAVNKAELVVQVKDQSTTPYTQPAKLLLALKTKTGTNDYLPDDPYPHNSAYFGGTYEANRKQYRFRISQYVQQVLDGKLEDYGLYLMVSGAATKADRLILNGTKATVGRMHLEITYTRIN